MSMLNPMEVRYKSVENFCKHGLIIPVPPLRSGANEWERMFHAQKRKAYEVTHNKRF